MSLLKEIAHVRASSAAAQRAVITPIANHAQLDLARELIEGTKVGRRVMRRVQRVPVELSFDLNAQNGGGARGRYHAALGRLQMYHDLSTVEPKSVQQAAQAEILIHEATHIDQYRHSLLGVSQGRYLLTQPFKDAFVAPIQKFRDVVHGPLQSPYDRARSLETTPRRILHDEAEAFLNQRQFLREVRPLIEKRMGGTGSGGSHVMGHDPEFDAITDFPSAVSYVRGHPSYAAEIQLSRNLNHLVLAPAGTLTAGIGALGIVAHTKQN